MPQVTYTGFSLSHTASGAQSRSHLPTYVGVWWACGECTCSGIVSPIGLGTINLPPQSSPKPHHRHLHHDYYWCRGPYTVPTLAVSSSRTVISSHLALMCAAFPSACTSTMQGSPTGTMRSQCAFTERCVGLAKGLFLPTQLQWSFGLDHVYCTVTRTLGVVSGHENVPQVANGASANGGIYAQFVFVHDLHSQTVAYFPSSIPTFIHFCCYIHFTWFLTNTLYVPLTDLQPKAHLLV